MAILNKCMEYYESGNNIDSLEGFASINTTNGILNEKNLEFYEKNDLKKLITSFKKARNKSFIENKPFEKAFDMTAFNWSNSSLGINGDDDLILEKEDFFREIIFINSLKINDDFCEAIVINDDNSLVWIVIKESNFKNNKKYFKYAREFKKNNECDFEMTIFDEKQLEQMKEEIISYKNYKVIT